MNNNKTKNIILAVLVIGLVGMTIAYASLTQTLTINNNQATVSSNWRVRFAPTVTTSVGTTIAGTTTGASYTQNTPVLDNDRQTIKNLQATFTKPGDYVEVAFTVRNEGNIAAKGQSVTLSLGNLSCANGTGSSIDQSDLNTFCGKLVKWVKHSDRTTDWSSSDTLAPYSGSGNDYPHIDGVLRIEYPSTLSASDIAVINGGSVVVTLGDTSLHFEQNDSYTPTPTPTPTGFNPAYYSINGDSWDDNYSTISEYQNVFLGMDSSYQKGVCINQYNNGIKTDPACFQSNNYNYEYTHMTTLFNNCYIDIVEGTSVEEYICSDSVYECRLSADGDIKCSDDATDKYCSVSSTGSSICGTSEPEEPAD